MTPEQLDIDIEELSTRMERVRSLYEQYFMGIERLEPTIPRKDVERRIQALRKIRFQNTAKRFKFQTLVQRYNSLQQYWNRTCRDIENGTYKRHVQKAERRFGNTKATHSLSTEPHESAEQDSEGPADRAAAAREQAGNDLASLLDSNTDLDAAMNNVLAEFDKKPSRSSTETDDRTIGKGLLGRLGKTTEATSAGETGLRTKTSPTPLGLQALPALKRSATAPQPLKPLPSSEVQPQRVPGRSEPPRPHKKSERPPPPIAELNRAALSPQPPARPARPQTTPGLAGLPPRGIPPLTPAGVPGGISPQPTAPRQTQPVAPARPAVPPRITSPTAATAKPTGTPQQTVSPAMRPTPPAMRPTPPAARPIPPVAASPGPTAARPAPARSPSVPARPGAGAQLSEDRIKALHQSYVDARRQTNASSVSLEKLAKSLRDTEQKLRQKHAGRSIDFDVSIKDGKAILKPKLT